MCSNRTMTYPLPVMRTENPVTAAAVPVHTEIVSADCTAAAPAHTAAAPADNSGAGCTGAAPADNSEAGCTGAAAVQDWFPFPDSGPWPHPYGSRA